METSSASLLTRLESPTFASKRKPAILDILKLKAPIEQTTTSKQEFKTDQASSSTNSNNNLSNDNHHKNNLGETIAKQRTISRIPHTDKNTAHFTPDINHANNNREGYLRTIGSADPVKRIHPQDSITKIQDKSFQSENDDDVADESEDYSMISSTNSGTHPKGDFGQENRKAVTNQATNDLNSSVPLPPSSSLAPMTLSALGKLDVDNNNANKQLVSSINLVKNSTTLRPQTSQDILMSNSGMTRRSSVAKTSSSQGIATTSSKLTRPSASASPLHRAVIKNDHAQVRLIISSAAQDNLATKATQSTADFSSSSLKE